MKVEPCTRSAVPPAPGRSASSRPPARPYLRASARAARRVRMPSSGVRTPNWRARSRGRAGGASPVGAVLRGGGGGGQGAGGGVEEGGGQGGVGGAPGGGGCCRGVGGT